MPMQPMARSVLPAKAAVAPELGLVEVLAVPASWSMPEIRECSCTDIAAPSEVENVAVTPEVLAAVATVVQISTRQLWPETYSPPLDQSAQVFPPSSVTELTCWVAPVYMTIQAARRCPAEVVIVALMVVAAEVSVAPTSWTKLTYRLIVQVKAIVSPEAFTVAVALASVSKSSSVPAAALELQMIPLAIVTEVAPV